MTPFKVFNLTDSGLVLRLVRNGGVVEFPYGAPTTLQQNTTDSGFCIAPIALKEVSPVEALNLTTLPIGVNGTLFTVVDGIQKDYRYNNLNSFKAKLEWLNTVGDNLLRCEYVDGSVVLTLGDTGNTVDLLFIDEDVNYAQAKLSETVLATEHTLQCSLMTSPLDIQLVYLDGTVEKYDLATKAITQSDVFPGLDTLEIQEKCESIAKIQFGNKITALQGEFDSIKCIPEIVINISGTIDKDCFYGGAVKTVKLGNGVTGIGDFAFAKLKNPLKLTLGSGVDTIENQFSDTVVTLDSIPEGIKKIGSGAFEYCTIEHLELPSTLRRIGYKAFFNCNTQRISFAGPVIIGDSAFEADEDKAKPVMIDLTNVAVLGDRAFFGYTANEYNLIVPGSVSTIGDECFGDWSSATGLVIESGVQSLGYKAFNNWQSAKSLVIADTVTATKQSFPDWVNCEAIVLSKGLTEIGTNQYPEFANIAINHKGLTVSIPDTVTAINHAFTNAHLEKLSIGKAIKSISRLDCTVDQLYVLADTPPTIEVGEILPTISENGTVYVDNPIDYRDSYGWDKYNTPTEDGRDSHYTVIGE